MLNTSKIFLPFSMHTAQCNSIWQPVVAENLSVTCITCKKKLKSKLQSQIIFFLFFRLSWRNPQFMLKKRRKRQGPLPYLIVMNGRISIRALHFVPLGLINFRLCGTYQHLSISFLPKEGRGGGGTSSLDLIYCSSKLMVFM